MQLTAFFLAGPTAVGKTGIAHRLALRDGYDILSADAMLVYRGMNIGTAKPTARQRREVRYFGIDIADPRRSFSVAAYLEAVAAQLRDASPPLRRLLVTGGTGLYIKALTMGLDSGPAPDPEQRRYWDGLLRENGVAALRAELARRAPDWLAALPDPDNPRRLIRALEWSAAGFSEPPHCWRRPAAAAPLIGLRMDTAMLRRRIEQRVHAMIRKGLWEETSQLAAAGLLGGTARHAIGYAEALALLSGKLAAAAASERIIVRTRQLAKRQMTWLRHQTRIEWITLDSQTGIGEAVQQVSALWSSHGPVPLAIPENRIRDRAGAKPDPGFAGEHATA